jgi:16S rRNA (guanine527-N7)-methyltransferase
VFAELLVERMSSFVELTPLQINQLEDHFHLLNRWNKVLNLSAIRDVESIVERHYCESLFLGAHLPQKPATIADIGSGAGFPGIPVAIQMPYSQVSLIESHQRKSVFLVEATRGLGNIRVVSKRAEGLNERFDWVIMRGVNFSETEDVVRKLASNVAFLGGAENPSPRFTWNNVKLPWGKQRFLWIGRFT